MRDIYVAPDPPAETNKSTTVSLFLGLYLLVLAFFILLVTISTPEDVKSKAVMDSLSSAFKTILPPTSAPTAFTSKEGNFIAGENFQNQLVGLFSTEIKVVKVDVVKPGKLMRVVILADTLFFPETENIRPAQQPFMDRVVAALSGNPQGLYYEVQFVIGSAYESDKELPIGLNLELRRASAFVKEMLARGAPPASLSIGLKPGDPRYVVLWFNVRYPKEINPRGKTAEEEEELP